MACVLLPSTVRLVHVTRPLVPLLLSSTRCFFSSRAENDAETGWTRPGYVPNYLLQDALSRERGVDVHRPPIETNDIRLAPFTYRQVNRALDVPPAPRSGQEAALVEEGKERDEDAEDTLFRSLLDDDEANSGVQWPNGRENDS